MKKIIAVAAMVMFALSAQVAHADYMLKFTDGTACVWKTYYAKDSRYCTMKGIGEVCWAKADVVKIIKVAAGTEASDYTVMSVMGGNAADQRNAEGYSVNSRAVAEMEKHREKQEQDVDARAAQERIRLLKNRKEGKADWAQ
jgi:hypothetical protein